MFDVDALLADLESASREAPPPLAVKDVMTRGVSRPNDVAGVLKPATGGLGLLLHRPDLTVIDARWAPGMRLMPHDHRMWAVIAVYQGSEDNTFYRRGNRGSLVESNGRRLEAGDVVVLGDATVHAVANPAGVLTGAIHVYGGDFVNQPRSQWGPDDLVERPFDLDEALRQFRDANLAAGLAAE